jgi:Transcriptional Coactivator p15 (PC4)
MRMTRKPAPLPEPLIVSEWWKNRSGASIRLVLNEFNGRNVVDLRTRFTSNGELKPGKGFAAEVRHLPQLAKAIVKAEAKARELGLISDDEIDP